MATVQKHSSQQREPVQGSPFVFEYPKAESLQGTWSLVSVLKKKITEANVRARDSFMYGNESKAAGLRLAVAYASDKLSQVINRRCDDPWADKEAMLKDAIRVIDKALKG